LNGVQQGVREENIQKFYSAAFSSSSSSSTSRAALLYFSIRKDYTSARATLTHLYNSTWVGIVAFQRTKLAHPFLDFSYLEGFEKHSEFLPSNIAGPTLRNLLLISTVVGLAGHCIESLEVGAG